MTEDINTCVQVKCLELCYLMNSMLLTHNATKDKLIAVTTTCVTWQLDAEGQYF